MKGRFILLLLIYLFLLVLNTNHIEKKMIYTLLTNGDFNNISKHPVPYKPKYLEFFTAPFYFDKNRLTKVTDGELINAYCFTTKYAKTQQLMQSKMFWNDYFIENDIKVPTLYATTKPFEVHKTIVADEEYICKPEYGTTGEGVSLILGKDIKQTDVNNLIQQKVNSCEYNGSRTFRVITMYDGDVLAIYEFKNDDKVVSNLFKGGTARICGTTICDDIQDNHKIQDTIDKLRELHKRDFNFAFSIGWDLMLDCDGAYVLEGNWPSGLYGNRKNKDDFIEEIKPKAEKFYLLNNI